MTEQDFLTYLDSYGADITQWPDAAAAEDFVREHAYAAAALADLLSLDMFLEQNVAVDNAQSERVLQRVNEQLDAETVNLGASQLWHWSQVAAAIVPLVISFAVGLSLGSGSSTQSDALSGDVENNLYLADHWLFESSVDQDHSEETTL